MFGSTENINDIEALTPIEDHLIRKNSLSIERSNDYVEEYLQACEQELIWRNLWV
jgi:hypothetical protein